MAINPATFPTTTVHSEVIATFTRSPTQTTVLRAVNVDPALVEGFVSRFPPAGTSPELRKCVTNGFRAYEIGADPACGVLLKVREDLDLETARDYFASLILNGIKESPAMLPVEITELFEEHLLYDAHKKRAWKESGLELFRSQVEQFTSRRVPVQFALPAFPCKTTNPEKAFSALPDGAEYEALANLRSFCERVSEVYEPGCYINIVSDGHVFSDCQGTDDDVVHTYNAGLKTMLAQICSESHSSHPGIKFYDLSQLLLPNVPASTRAAQVPRKCVVHPVPTYTSRDDDNCRGLMIAVWSPPGVYYRDLIRSQPDHPITALYRGFSRFMFEDLAYIADYRTASKNQRKRVAESVAFTMIQRNQTYSRMVESVFPMHVRLSIHAHDNAGPRFAVRVMPPHTKTAKDVTTLLNAANDHGMDNDHEARHTGHIPTPWHNALVEVISDDSEKRHVFLCKAKLANDLLQYGYEGAWDAEHARGARFVFKINSGIQNAE
ncbi:dityrosine synthesis enzyme [Lithohypha guttulata]|uniref:Dityrosine synthesis enzyme n=1 Tax=Lithohypha guttulata TaxID=1690604 RepID=A0AAN7T4W1_9EURO|nr:dityrosine synthesis enzyme [Lithohypha guttulata]